MASREALAHAARRYGGTGARARIPRAVHTERPPSMANPRIQRDRATARRSRLLLAVVAGLASACGARGPEPPENLLFLCVDTLRADQLGAYGQEPTLTPAIDALASESVVFENALTHASWTLPSFASLLTSQYTSTHGCWTFEDALPEGFTTLTERFRDAGFRTYGIASHVFFQGKYGLLQGFDDFDEELAHSREQEGWVKVTSPLVSERAVRWLQERASRGDGRWLLWLHYFDPHIPYVDHERGDGPSELGEFERYRSEIAHTDRHLKSVLDALERLGFAERTAVVFVSDHGESFYEHAGVFRHARSLYGEELRVPLILRVPGLAPRRVAELVRTVDLKPTLLEVFGLDPRPSLPMEGESLLPVLRGQPSRPRAALAEIDLHDDGHHLRSFVSGRWKLIERRTGGFQLHDLEADPQERTNLASVEPDRVRALRAEMEAAIRRAESRGAGIERTQAVDHSPEQIEHLRAMGYVGDDEG